MSEMVDRVARAIERAMAEQMDPTPGYLARAAIEAVREPTEGMELAGDQVGHYSDAPAACTVWLAMIDEALK